MQWYRTANNCFHFTIVDGEAFSKAIPAAEIQALAALEDDAFTREEWQQKGLSVPSDQPEVMSPWQTPTVNVLPGIMQHLSPQDLLNAFRVSKAWRGTPESDDMMRNAFEQLDNVDPTRQMSEALTRKAQGPTPYRSRMQMNLASRYQLRPGPSISMAWGEYQKASDPKSQQIDAVLHSMRNKPETDYWQALQKRTEADDVTSGALYAPSILDPDRQIYVNRHNMVANSIWLLGLMHGHRNLTAVTPLTRNTLTRGYSGHPERRGEQGVSAIGREILAATSTHRHTGERFYTPQQPLAIPVRLPGQGQVKPMITQTFSHNPSAMEATFDDIVYPDDMRAEEARQRLRERGVHTQEEAGLAPQDYRDALILDRLSALVKDDVRRWHSVLGEHGPRQQLITSVWSEARLLWLPDLLYSVWRDAPNSPQEIQRAEGRFMDVLTKEYVGEWIDSHLQTLGIAPAIDPPQNRTDHPASISQRPGPNLPRPDFGAPSFRTNQAADPRPAMSYPSFDSYTPAGSTLPRPDFRNLKKSSETQVANSPANLRQALGGRTQGNKSPDVLRGLESGAIQMEEFARALDLIARATSPIRDLTDSKVQSLLNLIDTLEPRDAAKILYSLRFLAIQEKIERSFGGIALGALRGRLFARANSRTSIM